MRIQLDDRYRLSTTGNRGFTLEFKKKMTANKGKNKGIDYESCETYYYLTIDQALKSYLSLALENTDLTEVSKLYEYITRIYDNITEICQKIHIKKENDGK